MANPKTFRTALGGFNREDVVRYIEYITNQHNAQLEQLNNQLRAQREELERLRAERDTAVLQE